MIGILMDPIYGVLVQNFEKVFREIMEQQVISVLRRPTGHYSP